MLERMTLAEDMGYNDSYFPSNNEDEQAYGTDPNEYILAHSPPVSPRDLLLSVDSPPERHSDQQERHDREDREDRERAAEDALHRAEQGEHGEQDSSERESNEGERAERNPSPVSNTDIPPELPASFEEDEEPILAPADREHNLIETGTHMSPDHPGYLEHVPSEALSPDQLHPERDHERDRERDRRDSDHHHKHHQPHAVVTREEAMEHQRAFTGQSQMFKQQRRRTKSFSDRNPVAEAVFYSYGVSVFFGFTETQEKEIMEDCLNAGAWSRPQEEDEWEVEECHYVVSP
jgi:hypothetical protein